MPRDQRLYMTFPNDVHRHPKIMRMSLEARWAFIEMNGEARLSDNDGVFTAEEALFHWSESVLAELCGSHPTRPLVTRDDEGNYRVRDYAEHQQTRVERERLAEVSRQNGRKGGRPKSNPWETQPEPKETQGVPGVTQTKAEKELEREKEGEKEKINPSSALVVPDLFSEFWSLWPRSEGKIPARKAWDKATRKIDATLLLELVRKYVEHPHRPPKQFVPHASTWLNENRWEDGEPTEQEQKRTGYQTNTEQNLAYLASLRLQESGQFQIEGAA